VPAYRGIVSSDLYVCRVKFRYKDMLGTEKNSGYYEVFLKLSGGLHQNIPLRDWKKDTRFSVVYALYRGTLIARFYCTYMC
jgi:hypothetical protein